MRSRRIVAIAVIAAALCFGTREIWLTRLGRFLIQTDELARADLIVVLAGDGTGSRLREALRLKREGYAPRVLAGGSAVYYGVRECDLALEWAQATGEKPEVEKLCLNARSTLEESRQIDAALRARGIERAIVVTSDFHSRRARIIFSTLDSPIDYRFAASPTRGFDPDAWWRSREGRKIAGVEWLKTVHSWWERPD